MTHGTGCSRVHISVCEGITICILTFHVPWEPVLIFQIPVVIFSHKFPFESDPGIMTSFVLSVRTILFKPLGALDFFFFLKG